jgi:uncharacterized protein
MGPPVVHFEILARDEEKLKGYYAELFDWEIDSANPMGYGLIDRAANLNGDPRGTPLV